MSKISFFTSAKQSDIPESTISISDFLASVRLGKWQKQIEIIRSEPDKAKRRALKETILPGITASGLFSKRDKDSPFQHSGFIVIDLDNFSDKTALLKDPYTYALLTSASGGGLAVFVKINPEKHKESFRWLQEYFFKTYGIVCDPAPSNHASLRFVSFDPDLFINEKSSTAKFIVKQPKKVRSVPQYFPDDKMGVMVKEAVDRGVNIAESYHEYLTLGFALSTLGESGRKHFHALAGVSAKYNSEHADRQFDICLKKPEGGITIGSFYYLLKQAGIMLPENSKYDNAIRTIAIGKKEKKSESESIAILTDKHHIPVEEAKRIAKEVHSRPDITLTSIAADPEKLIQSLVAWMEATHPIKKNVLTGKLENSKGEITKEKFNTIYLHARSAFNTPLITFDLIERVLFSEFTTDYNPIKDYIEANRHRNTTGNIDRIISSIKTPTPGSKTFIRKWLLAIPAAIEGKPVRLVLALTGVGLSGKTEWFRRLLPKNLKRYFGESKLMSGKDDELLMCEKLILLDDELGGKTKHDASHFKMLSSKDWFSLRAPFGRGNMDYKRLALLCGTSNEKEIINDPTGNTRILPVEVFSIDHELYNSVDKDELFMEVVRAYESGEDWNFTKEEVASLSETSKQFEGIKIEQELILRYFLPQEDADGNGHVEQMTAMEIKAYIEIRSMQKILNLRNFGMELKAIFGESEPKKIAGKTMRLYNVVKLGENSNLANPVPQLPKYEKNEEF